MNREVKEFMSALKKWQDTLVGSGIDYLSVLVILGGLIGPKGEVIQPNLTELDAASHLEKRLDWLIEECEMEPSVLILGLSQSLLQWLDKATRSSTGNLHLFEQMHEKFPDSDLYKQKITEMKSSEHQMSMESAYFSWLKISVTDLGFDTVESWNRDRFLAMSGK